MLRKPTRIISIIMLVAMILSMLGVVIAEGEEIAPSGVPATEEATPDIITQESVEPISAESAPLVIDEGETDNVDGDGVLDNSLNARSAAPAATPSITGIYIMPGKSNDYNTIMANGTPCGDGGTYVIPWDGKGKPTYSICGTKGIDNIDANHSWFDGSLGDKVISVDQFFTDCDTYFTVKGYGIATIRHEYVLNYVPRVTKSENVQIVVMPSTAEFFILKPGESIPANGADLGSSKYVPVGTGSINSNGYIALLGAGINSDKDHQLFDPTNGYASYVNPPALTNEYTGANVLWYVIKDQKNGIHVDGYVLDYPATVTYHANFGTPEQTRADYTRTTTAYTVKSYADIGLNSQPGYTFKGWSATKGSTTLVESTISLPASTDLYAVWDPNFTITASAGANGTITPNGDVTVASGATKSFSIKANTGYHIADVVVDNASVGAVASYEFKAVTANHTITASFEQDTVTPNTYTVTYNSGSDGKFENDETQLVYDKLANGTPTPTAPKVFPKSGYVFNGWDKAIEGKVSGNVTYTATYEKAVTVDVTRWTNQIMPIPFINTEISKKVSFSWVGTDGKTQTREMVDNGAFNDDFLTYNVSIPKSKDVSVHAIMNTGYSFEKWNCPIVKTTVATLAGTHDENSNLNPVILNVPNSYLPLTISLHLYGTHYDQSFYTLTYDKNGGDNAPPAVSGILKGTEISLASGSGLTHQNDSGKKVLFAGWTAQIKSKILDKSDTVPKYLEKVTINADTSVFAVWGYDTNNNGKPDVNEDKYTLTYRYDSSIVYGQQTYLAGEVIHAISAPSKPGYTFSGWDPALPATMPNTDLTVTAKWTFNGTGPGDPQITTYRVDYNGNGNTGGNVPASTTYVSGANVTVQGNTNNLVLTNACFIGFSKTKNSLITTQAAAGSAGIISSFVISANTTLYAVWAVDNNNNNIPDYNETPTTPPTPPITPTTPPTDIPDDDTPLGPNPGDNQGPGGNKPGDGTTDIEDEAPPLGSLPKTGDNNSAIILIAVMVSALFGISYTVLGKKRKKN